MKISQLMTTYIDFAEPTDTVDTLAELMGDLDVGAVPVGTAEVPLGIVTDRDVLFRVVAKGLDPKSVTVGDILSAPLICCSPETGLEDALDLMAANHLRRLAVRTGEEPIIGWITLSDISRALLLKSDTMTTALRELSAESAA